MDAQPPTYARFHVNLDGPAMSGLSIIQDHLRSIGTRGTASEAIRFAVREVSQSINTSN